MKVGGPVKLKVIGMPGAPVVTTKLKTRGVGDSAYVTVSTKGSGLPQFADEEKVKLNGTLLVADPPALIVG